MEHKKFNITMVIAIILIGIFAYHTFTIATIERDTDMTINAFTNVVRIDMGGALDDNPFGGLAQIIGAPIIEHMFNRHARERFDIYAMILPYHVTFK